MTNSTTDRATAAARRAVLEYDAYHIAPFSFDRDDYLVVHTSGRNYTVDAESRTCTCPWFRRHRVCKHRYMVGLKKAEQNVPMLMQIAPALQNECDDLPIEDQEMSEEEATELQRETDVETDRMRRRAQAVKDRDLLWPDA